MNLESTLLAVVLTLTGIAVMGAVILILQGLELI